MQYPGGPQGKAHAGAQQAMQAGVGGLHRPMPKPAAGGGAPQMQPGDPMRPWLAPRPAPQPPTILVAPHPVAHPGGPFAPRVMSLLAQLRMLRAMRGGH